MSQTEWLADLAKAAEDLGYGIASVEPRRIELVGQQTEVTVVIESVFLSGDWLREHLIAIPHRSGSGYTRDFQGIVGHR